MVPPCLVAATLQGECDRPMKPGVVPVKYAGCGTAAGGMDSPGGDDRRDGPEEPPPICRPAAGRALHVTNLHPLSSSRDILP
jgi:hypothetical protein